ncbi:hypothetical protein B0J13DRAFT_599002 [Dactylonectria estremocensis]|uniref:Uncharacterized protein n=1 Tax=Dactylonectria estremocensis TaxID=1079267 RepID=A0A9P9ILR7_9HYPO|nr:hypothetical protein B0J13DRAFT_599002 [Dactylonectria estremocensis]
MAEVGQSVCMICGVSLSESSPPYKPQEQDPPGWSPYKWRESHAVITGPTWSWEEKGPKSMTVPDELVSVFRARVYNRGQSVSPSGLPIGMQLENLPEQHENHDPADGKRWYLPIHSACETMAGRAMQAPQSRIRSIGDLWMTLDRRCVKTAWDETVLTPYLPKLPDSQRGEPIKLGLRRYYIPSNAIYAEWPESTDPAEQWWYCDLLNIPNLTSALMSNLERLEPPAAGSDQFTNRFKNLPREIEDAIAVHLSENGSSLECTHLIPQSFWKEAFLQIPFLWDVKMGFIEDKEEEAASGGFEWNWEKLTRQVLAEVPPAYAREEKEYWSDDDDEGGVEEDDWDEEEPTPWNYSQVGLVVPPGFINRRRIWQILVDMYPNDVGMVHSLD